MGHGGGTTSGNNSGESLGPSDTWRGSGRVTESLTGSPSHRHGGSALETGALSVAAPGPGGEPGTYLLTQHVPVSKVAAMPPGWDTFSEGLSEGDVPPFSAVVVAAYDRHLRTCFEDVRYTTSIRRPEDVLHAAAAWR